MNERLMFTYNSEAKVSREGELPHPCLCYVMTPNESRAGIAGLVTNNTFYFISTDLVLFCIGPRSAVLFIPERIQSNHEVQPRREWM